MTRSLSPYDKHKMLSDLVKLCYAVYSAASTEGVTKVREASS